MAKKKKAPARKVSKASKAFKPKAKAKVSKPAPKVNTSGIKFRRPKSLKKITPVTVVVRSSLLPEVKKATPASVPPLTADQIQKFRDILTEKRDDLAAIVQRKKEEEIEDIGVGDEADVATHSVEKEMLFELTDSEKQTLDMVEAALRRMDKSIFGVCESCQRGIPRMRLQVMPWARYCINCQSRQEIPSAPPPVGE